MNYIVVGAGLFGAVVAHELHEAHQNVIVVERRDHIGGNCYTEDIEGITVHKYGPHVFHTNSKEVWNYVNKFAEMIPYQLKTIANYQDELYSLPFNMYTFEKIYGSDKPSVIKQIISDEIAEFEGDPTANLENKAISLVGRQVYEMLIKGYTEKQWQRSCKDLPADIITRLPVRYTFDNNYFNDIYQGIPKEGYTHLINNLLSGITVITGIDDFVEDINYWKKLYNTDKVIYTGAIDEFYNYELGRLKYRSLKFRTGVYKADNIQGCPVMNFTDKRVPYTRCIEHKHFNNAISDKTVITYEYSREYTGNADPYYPINNIRNNFLYKEYKSLSKDDKDIIFGGRLGSYKYYDMDDTIISALGLVRNLLKS